MIKKIYILPIIITFFCFNTQASLSKTFSLSNGTKIVIERGDITRCHVDAIVNAANEHLVGSAGICGAIFNAAGYDRLQDACDQYPEHNRVRCSVGQACITDSFKLSAQGIKKIIHTVGPDCRIIKGVGIQNLFLSQAYKNSLILAEQNDLSSIAFPFISAGTHAFPKQRAADIALQTVVNYFDTQSTITSVHFILFSHGEYTLFCNTMESLVAK